MHILCVEQRGGENEKHFSEVTETAVKQYSFN
jgi:hypothetical protein